MKIKKTFLCLAFATIAVACTVDATLDTELTEVEDIQTNRLNFPLYENDRFEDELHWVSFAIAEALVKDEIEITNEINNQINTFGLVVPLDAIYNSTTHTRTELIKIIAREMRTDCNYGHPDLNVSKPTQSALALRGDPPVVDASFAIQFYENEAAHFWQTLINDNCIEIKFINGLSNDIVKEYYSTAHPLSSQDFNEGYYFSEDNSFVTNCGIAPNSSPYTFWPSSYTTIEGENINNKHIVLARPYRSLIDGCDYSTIPVDNLELFPYGNILGF